MNFNHCYELRIRYLHVLGFSQRPFSPVAFQALASRVPASREPDYPLTSRPAVGLLLRPLCTPSPKSREFSYLASIRSYLAFNSGAHSAQRHDWGAMRHWRAAGGTTRGTRLPEGHRGDRLLEAMGGPLGCLLVLLPGEWQIPNFQRHSIFARGNIPELKTTIRVAGVHD